jgi:microcompartment protein CcmK/EutM
MYIGQVTATVVATIKHATFRSHKLLYVQRLDPRGEISSSYDICVDTVQAGIGDTVLVMDEGTGARQVLGQGAVPGQGAVRAVIVGIVDGVHLTSSE